MEVPSDPATQPVPGPALPRRSRRRILVLVIAVVLVLAAVLVGWFLLRPWTIGQVFGLAHYQPGNAVTVAGTITGVYPENTSYGPRVALQLDGQSLCPNAGDVFGDPNATYRSGESFQTTLHFQSYTFNGDPAVSAPELACPFPVAFEALGGVLDAVSESSGLMLVYNGTLAGGWSEYTFLTTNDASYNPAVLPVTLRKSMPVQGTNPQLPAGATVDSANLWNALTSLQYVGVSGGFQEFPIVDRMASLASPSANGSLRFVDVDHNGLVSDGDHLDVNLPPTASATTWDTYLLAVGSLFSSTPTYVSAAHYILNGPSGPLETWPSSRPTMVELQYVGDSAGPPLRSTVQVSDVAFGSPPALSDVEYELLANGSASLGGALTSLPASGLSGLTLSFADANANGRLDAGDRFTVGGIGNETRLSLVLSEGGRIFGGIEWIVGYGQPAPFIPDQSFAVAGSGPWTITATVPTWSPELALNRTIRASVFENGTEVITNASLFNGLIGSFANGTLTFTDADGDGFLSTGDYFTLNGNPANAYELQISVLFESQVPPVYM